MKIDYKLRGVSGIYKITNILNNKFYIGSSKNIYNRLHTHLNHLKNNRHSNKHLQSAVNKYGIENFIFDFLEICKIDAILQQEQYWIDTLSPQYNKNFIVTEPYITDWTEERRKAASIRQLEFEKTRKTHPSGKPVILYSNSGELLQEFSSIAELARHFSVKYQRIKKAIKYHTGYYKGYQLRYKNGDTRPVTLYKRTVKNRVIKLSKIDEKKICSLRVKGISRKEVARKFNISVDYVSVIIRKNKVKLGKRENVTYKRIKALHKKGMKMKEIAKKFKIDQSWVSRIINNKTIKKKYGK